MTIKNFGWLLFLAMFYLSVMRLGRRCGGVSALSERYRPTRLVTSYRTTELQPVLVSIEGNIGAGKTTLLNNLRERNPTWHFIDEPVDHWSTIQNSAGESILEVFYKDRKRWSYTFQNCALLTRHQNIEKAVNTAMITGKLGPQVFLTERCLDTDYHVFTKMLRDEGSIDPLELHLYEMLLHQLRSTSTPLAGIVHVDTHPSLCKERIVQRSRGGEEAISLEYLQALDRHQCKWVHNTSLPTTRTGEPICLERVEEFIEDLRLAAQMPQRSVNEQPGFDHYLQQAPTRS